MSDKPSLFIRLATRNQLSRSSMRESESHEVKTPSTRVTFDFGFKKTVGDTHYKQLSEFHKNVRKNHRSSLFKITSIQKNRRKQSSSKDAQLPIVQIEEKNLEESEEEDEAKKKWKAKQKIIREKVNFYITPYNQNEQFYDSMLYNDQIINIIDVVNEKRTNLKSRVRHRFETIKEKGYENRFVSELSQCTSKEALDFFQQLKLSCNSTCRISRRINASTPNRIAKVGTSLAYSRKKECLTPSLNYTDPFYRNNATSVTTSSRQSVTSINGNTLMELKVKMRLKPRAASILDILKTRSIKNML